MNTIFIYLNLLFIAYTLCLNVPKIVIILKENNDKHLQYFTYFAIISLS
jgi:hypothetical protein